MLLEEFNEIDKPIFTPSCFIDKRVDCPKIAVGFFSQGVEDRFVSVFKPEIYTSLKCGYYVNLYKISWNEKEILFFHSPIGAPATIGLMEEMKELGVENFLMAGTCGVLDNTLEPYSLIVPYKAIRDEGTSYHYLASSDTVDLNKNIVDRIDNYLTDKCIRHIKGITWTTDAIYRETVKKTEDRKNIGAICVEMECASMAAMSKLKGINFGQILYGADVVVDGKHDGRNLINADRDVEEKIIRLVIDCATTIY